MHTEPDDFRELRKLMALKRHESPPPGYFNRFSAKVVARLEAQRIHDAVPVWRRWLSELVERPALTGVYALLFGGLGMVALGLVQTPMTEGLPPTEAWAGPASIEPFVFREVAVQPVSHAAIQPSSVSPVVWPAGSPFAQYGLRAERASFHGR
jgi:hypothetical protein